MGKFDGILICTDLDGTLLGSDHKISRENIDAIEYFKSEGGFFTFITGRMPYFVSNIYSTIQPNAPFGCINGGGIFDHRTQQYLYTEEISRTVLDLVGHVYNNMPDMGIQINCFERIYFSRDNTAMEWFRKVTGSPNIAKHYSDVTDPIAKIVFGDMRNGAIEELEKLLRSHPAAKDFDLISSEATLFEILPKDICKGSVLPRLASILNVDMSKTVAVGDYNNDVSMLRTAGVGIAVANACEEAKAAADIITVSNDEHAIRQIIYDIESGNIVL